MTSANWWRTDTNGQPQNSFLLHTFDWSNIYASVNVFIENSSTGNVEMQTFSRTRFESLQVSQSHGDNPVELPLAGTELELLFFSQTTTNQNRTVRKLKFINQLHRFCKSSFFVLLHLLASLAMMKPMHARSVSSFPLHLFTCISTRSNFCSPNATRPLPTANIDWMPRQSFFVTTLWSNASHPNGIYVSNDKIIKLQGILIWTHEKKPADFLWKKKEKVPCRRNANRQARRKRFFFL